MPAIPNLHLPGMAPKELRPCDIKRIVAERQMGFRVRQLEREERRRKEREQRRRRKKRPKGEPKEMKCPIVFRASFEQPIGPLNPALLKFPGEVVVELYQKQVSPAEWRARRPDTRIEFKITPQSLHSTMQRQMDTYFEQQRTPWEARDSNGPLAEDGWKIDSQSGQPYVTELRRSRLAEKEASK